MIIALDPMVLLCVTCICGCKVNKSYPKKIDLTYYLPDSTPEMYLVKYLETFLILVAPHTDLYFQSSLRKYMYVLNINHYELN